MTMMGQSPKTLTRYKWQKSRLSKKIHHILVTWEYFFQDPWQGDAEFAWYSLNSTRWTCLYGFEYDLGIHGFKPTWPCLIIELLAAQVKFLQASCYYPPFIFRTNVFGCFRTDVAHFELFKHKMPNQIMLSVHLYCFQIMLWSNALRVSAPTTTILPNTKSALYSLNCFGHVIFAQQTSPNFCKTFDSPYQLAFSTVARVR